ncbi:zinc finger MYND domain-containing protein 19-like isoform X2 [Rhopilema esculentum]|uniref:zinc finger MYND domain-containing protein 19-like isoform X2 n=1 Tax=Rhopilema esculentum TaxID=499914 RepID=UPI0031E3133F
MKNEILQQQDTRKLIVYIGKAAGKHKYSLIDEEDIPMVKRFRFEAKLDYDKNGNGAKVYAIAYDRLKEKHHGCYVHNYVWQKRCGNIAPGFRINHKNGVTVDNRLQNLELIPAASLPCSSKENDVAISIQESHNWSLEDTLYWKAISQIPAINLEDVLLHQPSSIINSDGEILGSEGEPSFFYECHYTPCCRIERELNDFRICGRCKQVRYCGPSCQEKDWPTHKPVCVSKRKYEKDHLEKQPER